jgi:trk system potassium uptake protein TrkH
MLKNAKQSNSKTFVLRMKREQQKRSFLGGLPPPKRVVLFFFALIILGAVLLSLPAAQNRPISFFDALFTSVSAVCVTGLSTVSMADTFSLFGRVVILLLFQTGGLGIMAISTMVALMLGKRIMLQERIMIKESFNVDTMEGIVRITRNLILFALGLETLGALVLTWRFLPYYGWLSALGQGFFHSVSAFCNAGFNLFADGFSAVIMDPLTSITLMLLIIAGGLGVTVIAALSRYLTRKAKHLSLHAKLVLTVSACLLVGGFLVAFLGEFNNPATFGGKSLGEKILSGAFFSVSARSAGFNMVDTYHLNSFTQFFLIFLMFVGASPGSTGSGIKTTTLGVLAAVAFCIFTGRSQVAVFGRSIGAETIYKALAILLLAIFWLMAAVFLLLITEKLPIGPVLFEVVAALSNAGISEGITPGLSIAGKVIVMITMFVGRLGTLLIGYVFANLLQPKGIHYPEEKVIIG